MELHVNYARTIDNRMKIFKVVSNEYDGELGYVLSYWSQDSGYQANGYFIVNGKMRGLSYLDETTTLQDCLSHLVHMFTYFYEDVELVYNGETIKDESPSDDVNSSILERLPFDQK